MINSSPKLGDILPLPSPKPEWAAFLQNRRSNLAKKMMEPGPSVDEIENILQIAARVPDHRKLAPWRFIVFKEDARHAIGSHIRMAFERAHPDAPEERCHFEAARFLRAPLVIAVVSAPVDCPRGTSQWEQQLSAGAVCYNLLLAAQAYGYGAQWLTEWYSYDALVCANMGLSRAEKIAGLMFIGTVQTQATERARPNLKDKVKYWI